MIRQRDQLELVRLHSDLVDRTDSCRPGDQVLYDSVRKFILGPGHHAQQRRRTAGRSPVAGRRSPGGRRWRPSGRGRNPRSDIVAAVEHPEWCAGPAMPHALFVPVGRWHGHRQVVSPETAGHRNPRLRGTVDGDVRTSRLVMLDASDFWAPYFGETEQRIARWAAKLEQLGSRALTTRDGRLRPLPADRVPGRSRIAFTRPRRNGRQRPSVRSRAVAVPAEDRIAGKLAAGARSSGSRRAIDPIWPTRRRLRRIGMRRVMFDMLQPRRGSGPSCSRRSRPTCP